jgi:hypothetical protein
MRALLVTFVFAVLGLFPGSGNAGDRLSDSTNTEKRPANNSEPETYRDHFLDFSVLAGRQDFAKTADTLRHQVDMVEDVVGLSPHVQEFFRSIPISVSEVACLNPTKDSDGKDIEEPKAFLHPACYGTTPPEGSRNPAYGSVWDSNKSRWTNSDPVALGLDTNLGVIMVRPIMLATPSPYSGRPVILHELLHAYHNVILPRGYKNPGILLYYGRAKDGQLYPADAYLMTNAREFFAVTASVFLYGNDGPLSRSLIKEKQPDYYKYLVYLFGFDPDPASSVSPLASAR